MRQILPFLTLFLALLGSTSASAKSLTATFDSEVGLPEGWQLVGDVTNNDDRGMDNTAGLWSNGKSLTDNYVVTEPVKGSLTFYWRSYGVSGSYPNGQILIYRYENGTLGERIWASTTYKGRDWKKDTVLLGDYQGQVAIVLYSACIDDVTYTAADNNPNPNPDPDPDPDPDPNPNPDPDPDPDPNPDPDPEPTPDPNAWLEDFSGNALPEGWEVDETGWSFADGVAHGAYAGYYDGYKHFLTTPALVAERGDKLQFQAKSTGMFTTIKISVSKDGGDFVSYESISLDNNMTEFATYTIKDLQPGIYQFRFANDDYDLDNFTGLKPLEVNHNAQITATSIPEKGSKHNEYTASISVKEMAGQSEQLTARFFIGYQQYGESIVETVEGFATKTFTVTFTPEEALSGEAYFTVSNEDIELQSAKIAVSIDEGPVLSEDNGSLDYFENWGDYDIVTLNYSMKAGWNIIILPFAVNDPTIFGNDVVFYELGDCTNNSLKFKSVNTLYAQTPYLFYTKTEKDVFQFHNVTYFRTNADPLYLQTTKNGAVFQGFYAPAEAGSLTDKYVLTDPEASFPKFEKATEETTMKGFRAYMEWPQSEMQIFLDNVNTGIRTIDNDTDATGGLYNLKGQRINPSARHGIFIIRSAAFPQGKKTVK